MPAQSFRNLVQQISGSSMIGQMRGHLTVVSRSGRPGNQLEYLAQCQICRALVRIPASYLREATNSCRVRSCNFDRDRPWRDLWGR
jgi:hypothetical protein